MKFAAVGRIGLRSHRQTTVNGLSRFYSSAFTMRDSLMKSAISSLDIGVAFEREEEAVHMAFQSASKSTVAWVDGEDEVSAEVDPFALVAADVRKLNKNVKDLLGSDHPVLSTVAQYFFDSESQGGKKIRPTMVLLTSQACSPENVVTPAQVRLAEITEMIHTASLLHDDVIDSSETRRGRASVNQLFGNKLAILAGDFLLARSSVCLARLRNVEVIELLATVIEHLVKGEVMQMKNLLKNRDLNAFDYYMRKNYYKTGSLMANSCRATAALEGHSLEMQQIVFDYGRACGAAFQLVDDMLDFTSNEADLGKPVLNDLRQGLSTAPVLFAYEAFPRIYKLAERNYEAPGDLEEAFKYVQQSDGLERTRDLALQYSNAAVAAALKLEKTVARDGMVNLARKITRPIL
jgi:solanesyl diphosphate synthase